VEDRPTTRSCTATARYRYYYFYLRDEVLGPLIVRMGTFIPFEAS